MSGFAYNKEAQDKYSQTTFEPFIKIHKDKQFSLDHKKDGEYQIRLMRPWSQEGVFAKGTKVHFFVGSEKQTVICPNVLGPNLCPFCKVHGLIKNESMYVADTADIRPNYRYYSNVVDMKNPGKGVMLWSYGPQIFFPLKTFQDKGLWGDITDPLGGRDILITRQVRGKVSDVVNPAPNPSPIANENWLDELINIDEVLPNADEGLVKKLFASHPWKVYEPKVESVTRQTVTSGVSQEIEKTRVVEATPTQAVDPEKHIKQAEDIASRIKAKMAQKEQQQA
jgi:hypothetical protein